VSALAFLTPGAVSESIVAKSPMERLARASGARFERRDGWNVAVGYDSARDYSGTVAFADRSHLVKIELHGPPPHQLELGMASVVDGDWWCPVTPQRTLVLGGPSARDAVLASGAHVVDLTSGLAAFALIGPLANELLARFCAIDVRPQSTPVAGFRPGSIARTPGYLLKTGEHELLIMVGWALGAYLWDVVADAAAHLGAGPVA
jgi:heterotetrameric sarcosine oxidase gamma subunit